MALAVLFCCVLPAAAQGLEGNEGTKTISFTYSIPFPVNNTITGNYRTVDGTATAADNDYIPVTAGTFSIPGGETQSNPIEVRIVGDRRVEPDESFTIEAFNVQNAQPPEPRIITIINDDVASLSVAGARVTEGNSGTTPMLFTVTLTPDAGTTISAEYATQNGTALTGSDYQPASGTIAFAPGQTTQTITVNVIGDTEFEPDETLSIIVTPRGGTPITAVGTITNDDTRPAARVTIVSGNNQTARLGQPLASPLVVQVVDATGAPVPGVSVEWNVRSGSATVNPTTSITDANGRASTTVTVNSIGTIVIDARVRGLDVVTFTANATFSLADRARGPVAIPIARALDQICVRNEDTFNAVCRALNDLSDDELTPALERVAPQQSGAVSKVTSEIISSVTSGISARLAAVRGGERFSVQRLTFNDIAVGQFIGAVLQETGTDTSDSNGWSAFLSGNLGDGERAGRDGALGFDLESRGLMFGVDRIFGETILGASLNLMQLDSTLSQNVGSVDTSGFALSVYGSRGGILASANPNAAFDGLHVEGSVSFGQSTYESEHIVAIAPLPTSIATSEHDANVFALAAATGIDAHRGRTDIDLSIGGTWSRADVGDLEESGSGPLILFVQGHEIESLTGTLALNVRATFPTFFGILVPGVRGEFVHEFRDDARFVTARFLRDRLNTSFTIPIDRPDANYGRVSAGLQAGFAYGWSAFLEVSQDVARDDLDFRNVQFNIQKSF